MVLVNMRKIEIVKSNLYALAFMALCFAAMAFVLCAFPWGSYGWMGRLDLEKLTPIEAQRCFVNYQPKKDIEMIIFGRTHRVNAGTNIQVQGQYVTLPEFDDKTKAWLIQTEDGRRGLCRHSELSDVINELQIAVYDHARQDCDWIYFHTIIDEYKIEELIKRRISFECFDSLFGPNINATTGVESGKYLVGYRGIDIKYNGELKEGLIASFINNRLDSVQILTYKNAWCPTWLAPFASNWMEHSAAYISPGYYKHSVKYGPLQASFYPYKWLARGIMGMVDVLFAFLVAAIVSSVIFIVFGEDKSRSNSFICTLNFLICGIAYTLYTFFTMELSPNLFIYGVSTIIALIKCMKLDCRCPKCRSLVEMKIIGTSYGEVKEEVSDIYSKKDKIKSIKSSGVVVDRQHVKNTYVKKYRMVTNRFCCPVCGYTYESKTKQTLSNNKYQQTIGDEKDKLTQTWVNKVMKNF